MMESKDARLYELLAAMCSPENEDLAGLNWVGAGEMVAALPAPARERLLSTDLGRQIQTRLWQIWSTRPEFFAGSDLERTLLVLADDALVGQIIEHDPLDSPTLRLLGKTGQPAAISHLAQLAASPAASLSRRSDTLEALGLAGSPAAVAAIEPWLADDTLRNTALLALGQANSPESAAVLLRQFKADDSGPIEEALQLLSNPAIAPLLLAELSLDCPPVLLPVLGQMSDETVVEPIRALLYEAAQKTGDAWDWSGEQPDYEQLISRGIEALALTMPSEDSVTALAELAREPLFDDDQRELTIRHLAQVSHPAAQQAMVDLVLDGELPASLRDTAADALPAPLLDWIEQRLLAAAARPDAAPLHLARALRLASSKTGRDTLLGYLRQPDPDVQDVAARSLAARHETIALMPLLNLLRERLSAGGNLRPLIAALGQLKQPAATLALIDLLRDDRQAALRKEVIAALTQIGDAQAAPALIELGHQLDTRNSSEWSNLATALATLGQPDGVIFLLEQIEQHPTFAMQWLGAFRYLSRVEAIPVLVDRGLTSSVAEVRERAVVGLGSIGVEQVIPGLITGLRDPAENVRLAAENALAAFAGEIENPATIDLLLDAAQDTTVTRNWSLLACLQHAQDDAARLACERLVAWLDQPDPINEETLRRIVLTLGKIRGICALEQLGDLLLPHPVESIRSEAARALGRIGDPAGAGFLLQALATEPQPAALAAIQQALTQVRFLCELMDHLPLTRDMLVTLSIRYQIRIFPDGRVTLPEGPPRPCREALKRL